MAKTWFSSDPHFFHDDIIDFCGRPFTNSIEMNEAIIERHNSVVKPEDKWYSLGDLHMGKKPREARQLIDVVKKLNGHKRLIMGNHDMFKPQVYLDCGFQKIKASHLYERLLFTHIPVHPASLGKARANVHGHIHNNQGGDFPAVLQIDKQMQVVKWVPYVNISVEMTDYTPVDIDWIMARVEGTI